MSSELSWLSACVALFGLGIVLQAILANLKYKPSDLLGPRDQLALDEHKHLARARRCQQNFIEALVMFVPLVVLVELTGRNSVITANACAIFFLARLIYIPSYVIHIPFLRTTIWAVGLFATIALFLQVLPFS